MLKFFIEKNSSVPFHTQLKEQIKIELALGHLRDGDVLPSIREVESTLGIGRMVVLRAYRELERCGILSLKPGRGVAVNHVPDVEAGRRMLQHYGVLAGSLEERLKQLELNRTSFARYFYRKCLLRDMQEGPILYVDSSSGFAQENADQVSSIWELQIRGISIEDLAALDRRDLRRTRTILTNYYRFEEVRSLIGKLRVPVVPISFDWGENTLQVLRKVPSGGGVLVVQSQTDFERHGEVFRKILSDSFRDQRLRFYMAHYKNLAQLRQLIASRKYSKVMISNRIWEGVTDDVRNSPKVFRPQIQLSVESILDARYKAGIVL